jgi:hypothetical protein
MQSSNLPHPLCHCCPWRPRFALRFAATFARGKLPFSRESFTFAIFCQFWTCYGFLVDSGRQRIKIRLMRLRAYFFTPRDVTIIAALAASSCRTRTCIARTSEVDRRRRPWTNARKINVNLDPVSGCVQFCDQITICAYGAFRHAYGAFRHMIVANWHSRLLRPSLIPSRRAQRRPSLSSPQ